MFEDLMPKLPILKNPEDLPTNSTQVYALLVCPPWSGPEEGNIYLCVLGKTADEKNLWLVDIEDAVNTSWSLQDLIIWVENGLHLQQEFKPGPWEQIWRSFMERAS